MPNTNNVQPATKLLSIGKAWINDRQNGRGTSPALTINFDRNLGLNITLTAGAQLVAFPNQKRDGVRDADYRIAVALPADVVDAEIARQRQSRPQTTAAVAVAG